MVLVRILLLTVIAAFFMPFLSVSCTQLDMEISFSGIEMVTGKNIDELSRYGVQAGNGNGNGSIFAIVLIVPSILIFAVSFVKLRDTVRAVLYIAAAVINLIMAFGTKKIFKIQVNERLGEFISSEALKINSKVGFVLYTASSTILLLAGIFMLIISLRKHLIIHPD